MSDSEDVEDGNPEDLPLGFDVIMRSEIWPHGEGPVHNYDDPCPTAPDSGARTDLHTTPSDGKRLCRYCEWPDGAEQALNYDDSLRGDGSGEPEGDDGLGAKMPDGWSDSPLFVNLVRRLASAYPNFRVTEQFGPEGRRYMMIEWPPDDAREFNPEAPGEFVSMVGDLDENCAVDTGSDRDE